MPGDGATRVSTTLGSGGTSVALVPDIFIPYINERMYEKSNLVRSGIVIRDPRMDELARRGGWRIQIPFWKALTGNDEVIGTGTGATDSDLTVTALSTQKEIAPLFTRGKAWGAEDVAKALAGSDPIAALGEMVADWWNWKEQQLLVSILTGVYADNAANDSSDLIHDISVSASTGASTSISANAVIDATAKLGDSAFELTALAVHSKVHACMQKQNLITFEPTSAQDIGFGTYLGKTLIVDDGLPKSSTASTARFVSYLFKPGAVVRGEGMAPVPIETDRDSLAGVDILIHRRHFVLHPRGFQWTDSPAALTPTNAECQEATSYDRVASSVKNCGVVFLRTNAIYP